MGEERKSITILMADDDNDDCLLAQEVLEALQVVERLDIVKDGVALMNYLYRREEYKTLKDCPLPGLILLDLHMPKKDGMESLREIKSDPVLRRIPIVVLSSSEEEEDIYASYDNGATSFIAKSVTFASLAEVVTEIARYWLEIVELPSDPTVKKP